MRLAFVCFTFCSLWTVACNASNQAPITLPATISSQNETELATALMQVFPDDGSVLYTIYKGFNDDEETMFEFAPADIQEISTFIIQEDIVSPNGIYRAFVACNEEHCQQSLFIENLKTNETTEAIFSLRMLWRPLQRVVWLNDTVLAFDQSSNPHQGFRFAVDVNQKQHLLTLLVYDECLVSETCGQLEK